MGTGLSIVGMIIVIGTVFFQFYWMTIGAIVWLATLVPGLALGIIFLLVGNSRYYSYQETSPHATRSGAPFP